MWAIPGAERCQHDWSAVRKEEDIWNSQSARVLEPWTTASGPGGPTQKMELTFSPCVTGACEPSMQCLLRNQAFSVMEAEIFSPEVLEKSCSIIYSMTFNGCILCSGHSLCKPCDILFQCVVQALDLRSHQILGFWLMLLWKHQKQGESDQEWEGQGLRPSCWGCHSCFTRMDKHCWWTQQPGRSVRASWRS